MPTRIVFRSGPEKIVDGPPEEIAAEFDGRAANPVRLTTVEGSVIFVNWSNVLYLEEAETAHKPVAAETIAAADPGSD
jgi:hypothetical protein